MANNNLTVQRLHELVHYDAETGALTWRIKPAMRINIGAPVGCLRKDGYLVTSIDKRTYRLHRLAWLYMTGAWPENDIDHIDGNRSNNAVSNLRDVSRSVNAQNKREAMGHNKSSGILGVSQKRGGWRARITFDGREHATHHATIEEARAAYIASKRAHQPGNTL